MTKAYYKETTIVTLGQLCVGNDKTYAEVFFKDGSTDVVPISSLVLKGAND